MSFYDRLEQSFCVTAIFDSDVSIGSNCEELNVSKSSRLCLGKRTSIRRPRTSLTGHNQT